MARILILALAAGAALRVVAGDSARVVVDTNALPADKAFVGEMLKTRIAERTPLSDKGTALTVRYELSPKLTGDRATVSVTGNVAVVRAGRFRGLVAGTGELLRSIRYGATSFSLASGERTFDPKCPMRLAYWARHFHNWYHMASANELKRYAEDLALWGVNAFDFQYCYPEVNLDHATPDEIAAFERISRQLVEHLARLDCDFETFGGGNQIPDDWPDSLRGVSPKRGEWGGGCPSKPEALARMVDLRRQALATLKGVDVAYMRHWPYDEGGCACADCRPWGGNGYPKICRLMNEMNRYEYMNRSFTLDSSAAYDLDPVESYRDYATWWYRKMMETGACDHLYWDDVFCQSSFNLVQTDAYRLPNGRIQPSSGIFNMRELVKRCAVLQAEMGRDTRGNWVHMTNTALAPVLSFAGVNYDWEDIADERPFQERYSRGYILATAIGRQFGNRVGIMGYFSKDDPDTYAWLAHTGVGVMLTHELRWNASGHDEYVAAHKFLCDWGYRTDAVEVWNYWDEDVAYPLEVTGVENTSIALAKATSGEAMVCVSSFAPTNGTVRIRPDMEALGLNEGPWRACHALTDEEIPVVDGAVELQLARYDWALVRINGPRKVEPLDPESLPEGYDELVEFVEADGAQWIDTGIDPNPRTTRIRARFVPLEILPASSASDRIVLFGVNGTKGNAFDAKNCNAVLGYGSDNGYQVCPLWTGSSGGGYHYPGAGNYTVGKAYEIDFRDASVKSSAYVNTGFRCGGYNAKYDGRLGKTLFLGDINDAGRGLYTETSFGGWRRGKVRWLGLTATDGEGRLVADFRPAKKDGVAGFWDAVSGRFFRSRGDRDFAAPQYVRWTGGTSFADGVIASVPPDVTVRASYADVAALNRLAGIRLEGVTSGLVFTNGDRNATLYAPFSGRGRVVNAESNPKSSCALTFEGDSSFFAGEFLVTNAATAAKFAPYAFGVTNRVTVNNASGGGSDTRRFRLESAVHSNEFHVVRASNLFFGVNDPTVTGPLYLDLPGGLTFHGNNQSLSLSGPIVTTVTNDASTVYLNSNTYLLGGEKAVKSFARKRVQASNTVRVGCPLRFLPQPFSYVIYDNCNFSWNEGATVKFERANVFEDDVFVLANYAAPNSSTRSGHLNLNGFDQRIGTLGVYCVSGFRVAEQWNANMRIGSETPATLTVRRTCRNDVAANLYHGTLTGAVSFRLDSTDATAGRIRFNCPGSDTTGFLEASRGTIEVLETASFPNLGGLVLSGTGEIRLLTSAVGDANPDFSVAFAAPADGARLHLGDRVELVAKTVFDGRRWLKPGVYGAAATGDVRANAHLSGSGTLRVLERGGGPAPGFLLLIR